MLPEGKSKHIQTTLKKWMEATSSFQTKILKFPHFPHFPFKVMGSSASAGVIQLPLWGDQTMQMYGDFEGFPL